MVETILFNLASKVVGKIGSLALQELGFGLGWDLEEELKTLEGTMTMIKAVIVDAEQKQGKDLVISIWLDRLQAAFQEADNVLDEFHYEALRRQVLRTNHGSFRLEVRKFFSCSSNPLVFSLKMGCKIKKIRKRLDMIADDRTKFQPITTIEQRVERRTHYTASTSVSSLVSDSECVGRDDDKKKILQLLMTKSSNNHDTISVIPIVGIGGLGKTTLAKVVFHNETVIKHFPLRRWVRVSQDFNVAHVMEKIIHRTTDFPCPDLKKLLREKLDGKRFLLVLDDVRGCDNRDWVKFFKFLRGCSNGSKIVVTTRNKSVASTVGTVPMYNLESLSDEDCHELLLKWAGYEKVGEQVHMNLSEIAMEIVKKCHGHPLAAKTLGSNLFMKTNKREWLHFKEKQLWELVQKKHDVLVVLRSSYDPLPANLKHCFIYCSIFPKNNEIEIDKLIQLWMALGFIQSSSSLNHELEDIGDEYLNQLCSIFFLEKIEQHGNLLNTCRMPEIVHDLVVLMANEECLSTTNYGSGLIFEKVKHVLFRDPDCLGEEVSKSLFKLKNLRTIFFPSQQVVGGEDFVDNYILGFKYLHALDLSNSCFQKLPHSIGNLKHLRFFDLSGNANIESLPNAICKLYNLQTLRIWYCVKIRELPKNIGNLISLRHLYLTTQQSCLPEQDIRRLTSLRSFQITGCENLTSLPEGMQFLVALKTITITACPNLTCLPSTMKNLAKLEILEISNCPNLDLSGWKDFRGLRASIN